MEIKASLQKPYTDKERMDFIVEYNHNRGLQIEETDEGMQALDYTDDEKSKQERERINMLYLTAADVERAIYKARGMDFDDVVAAVEAANEAAPASEDGTPTGTDIKALKIELRANNFYRGNPYIEQVGSLLGFTSEELDYLFENKELPRED